MNNISKPSPAGTLYFTHYSEIVKLMFCLLDLLDDPIEEKDLSDKYQQKKKVNELHLYIDFESIYFSV